MSLESPSAILLQYAANAESRRHQKGTEDRTALGSSLPRNWGGRCTTYIGGSAGELHPHQVPIPKAPGTYIVYTSA